MGSSKIVDYYGMSYFYANLKIIYFIIDNAIYSASYGI